MGMNRKYTDNELLGLLKKEAKRLGRSPVTTDFDSNIELPSSRTYAERFGRWLIALQKAGLEPARINTLSADEIIIRKTKIVNTLIGLNNKLGRTPKVIDIDSIIPQATVCRYFGSFNKALCVAGLVPKYSKKEYLYLSDDELLLHIKNFYAKHNRIPKISDFNMKPQFPSPAVYKRRFGGWGKAIRLAGFEPRAFPFRPIACEFYDGCFVKQGYLSFIDKIALYAAHKLLIFIKRTRRRHDV